MAYLHIQIPDEMKARMAEQVRLHGVSMTEIVTERLREAARDDEAASRNLSDLWKSTAKNPDLALFPDLSR